MFRLRPALKKINCVSCEIVIFSQFAISQIRNFPQSILQPDEQPDRHRMNTVSSGSHEPLGGPPGSVLTSIDISRRLFLNIQTLYQKAMSHCLNEVKVSLLLIAEIIIVVCSWDEKGKFSKIFKKIET